MSTGPTRVQRKRTNRRLFPLSILTECLLPPTLVTGFFGMNTKDMPFQNTEGGTWLAALVVLAAGLSCYWAFTATAGSEVPAQRSALCSRRPITHNAAARQTESFRP